MFIKMLLVFTGIGAAGVFTVFLLTIPLLRRLPKQSRVSVDGVWIGDEELDVCPGSVNNKPGVTQFEVLSRVLPWQPRIRPLTHVGSSIENIRRDTIARRSLKRGRDFT